MFNCCSDCVRTFENARIALASIILMSRVFPRPLQPAVTTSCISDRPAVNFIAGWKK